MDLIYTESFISNDENNNKKSPTLPTTGLALQSLKHVGQSGPFLLKHEQIYFCILNKLPSKGSLSRRAAQQSKRKYPQHLHTQIYC